jgi:hypothetical protein
LPGFVSRSAPPLGLSPPPALRCARTCQRDETCPISMEGWTRRVQFVREGGGGGGADPRRWVHRLPVLFAEKVVEHPLCAPRCALGGQDTAR